MILRLPLSTAPAVATQARIGSHCSIPKAVRGIVTVGISVEAKRVEFQKKKRKGNEGLVK